MKCECQFLLLLLVAIVNGVRSSSLKVPAVGESGSAGQKTLVDNFPLVKFGYHLVVDENNAGFDDFSDLITQAILDQLVGFLSTRDAWIMHVGSEEDQVNVDVDVVTSLQIEYTDQKTPQEIDRDIEELIDVVESLLFQLAFDDFVITKFHGRLIDVWVAFELAIRSAKRRYADALDFIDDVYIILQADIASVSPLIDSSDFDDVDQDYRCPVSRLFRTWKCKGSVGGTATFSNIPYDFDVAASMDAVISELKGQFNDNLAIEWVEFPYVRSCEYVVNMHSAAAAAIE